MSETWKEIWFTVQAGRSCAGEVSGKTVQQDMSTDRCVADVLTVISVYEKKVVRFKLRSDREKMNQRICISEHLFGTIKRAMGVAYFLLKGKQKISGEFVLMAMGYNLSRACNMFSFEELMGLVGA